MFTPDRALQQSFLESQRRLRHLSQRATWSPSVGSNKFSGFTSNATPVQDIGGGSYPTPPNTVALSLTLDPGRWVVVMELQANLAVTGGGAFEMGTVFIADTESRTVISNFPGTGGLRETHQAAVQAITSTVDVEASIEIYAGATPGWSFGRYDLYEASIIAYPG